ncbi:hypothetical protein Avbf_08610 [Armadillidium vulgare]|nr:hypothetical protein Avbf_08610 [Armadillidium vulgare]
MEIDQGTIITVQCLSLKFLLISAFPQIRPNHRKGQTLFVHFFVIDTNGGIFGEDFKFFREASRNHHQSPSKFNDSLPPKLFPKLHIFSQQKYKSLCSYSPIRNRYQIQIYTFIAFTYNRH